MQALEAAVKANSLEGVYAALRQLRTNESITEYMIQKAVERKNLEMVAGLLGAKSRQADATSMSHGTLWHAIKDTKDLQIIKLLIKVGYEPFPVGQDTALHWAAQAGALPLLEYIWEMASSRGVSINVQDSYGWIPLHTAAYYLNVAAVQFLFERGANVNALSDDRRTAFLCLLQNGHSRKPENAKKIKSITEAFVSAGLSLEESTFGGKTPLMHASYYGVTAAVKVLLSAGAHIDTKVLWNGKTALHFASQGLNFECIRLLLAAGADVNARDVDGNTPLHDACNHRLNAEEMIKQAVLELINHGAGINAKNHAGKAPLHVACENICTESTGAVGAALAIDVLLESGADVSIIAPTNESCLHLVVNRLCDRCYWALPWNEHRVRATKEYAACALGFIQRLLKAGVKADAVNFDGLTPIALLRERLSAAVLNQHKDVFAPIIVALIKGGDFQSSWGSVPEGCPGLGSAIEVVWNKHPEMLCSLFAKLSLDEQERVKMTLRCLQRYLPNEEVRMEIICKMY